MKDKLISTVQKVCGAEYQVVSYTSLSTNAKKESLIIVLEESLESLDMGAVVDAVRNGVSDDFALLYTTASPMTVSETETEETEQVNEQITKKRLVKRATERNTTAEREFNKRPLFQRYYFFSRGIFEGIVVSIVLFLIGLMGVSWLRSVQSFTRLEVPSKDL